MDKVSKPIPRFDTTSYRLDQEPLARLVQQRRTIRRQAAEDERAALAGREIEGDPFNILILNYTMKCPLACDYCCYGCSPKRTETMDKSFALDLVDQAAELGVFGQCGWTGGEPLIFYDEVLEITERMQERNLPFSMISSCYWAETREGADSVIADLARHGMAVFTATHDGSHENWVPQSYIRNAVEAALDRGVHVCLCASFYDDTLRLESMFPEFTGRLDVDFVNRVVLPDVGRAARRAITPQSYPNMATTIGAGACYKRIYHDLTVFWDGQAYPCCSIYNRATQGLSIGDLYEESLASVWDRLEGSLLYRMIKGEGFDALYDLLERIEPGLAATLPARADAVGPCHLCHLMFRDEDKARAIFDAVGRHERDQVMQLLRVVRNQAGAEAERGILMDALGN